MRGGISQVINEFIQSLGFDIPSWSGIALVIVLVIVFFPSLLNNAKTRQARVLWKDAMFANIEDRKRMQEEAFALVKNNESGLFGLVELSIASSQLRLAEETLLRIAEMKPNSKYVKREIRRLRFRIEQQSKRS